MDINVEGFRTVGQLARALGLSYDGSFSRARRGQYGPAVKIGHVALYRVAAIGNQPQNKRARAR